MCSPLVCAHTSGQKRLWTVDGSNLIARTKRLALISLQINPTPNVNGCSWPGGVSAELSEGEIHTSDL